MDLTAALELTPGMLVTVVLFILLLGALVLVHEWGHFIVARRLGVRVEEFAFGFPPRLASFARRGTHYVLNLLPLGGYVKIFGEGGEGAGSLESFASRPAWQRFSILAAGVFMNVVLAWVLFSVGHGLGLPTAVSDEAAVSNTRVTIVSVEPGSPAERAGLRFGDAIEELKTSRLRAKVERIEQVQEFILAHRGEEITITLSRGDARLEMRTVPRLEPPAGQGPLGIAMARVAVVSSPWYRAPWDGLRTTGRAAYAIVAALGRLISELFTSGRVSGDISGPVGIFVFARETAELGFPYLLQLSAILSVNLAVLNILPIPALDGGRVLFLFFEKVGGRRVAPKLEQAIHTVGLVMLLVLMAAITYRDIVRIF